MYNSSDFYCLHCGKKAMTLPRKASKKRPAHHRKKLYCPWCKQEINCIECRTDEEVFEFKNLFSKGEFENEQADSISYVRGTSKRQINVGA